MDRKRGGQLHAAIVRPRAASGNPTLNRGIDNDPVFDDSLQKIEDLLRIVSSGRFQFTVVRGSDTGTIRCKQDDCRNSLTEVDPERICRFEITIGMTDIDVEEFKMILEVIASL